MIRIRLSVGTAKVLGLRKLKMDVPLHTAYFLIGERCVYDCAYCSRAATSTSSPEFLSRVLWPSYDLEDVVERLRKTTTFERICVQVVNEPDYISKLSRVLGPLCSLGIPVSVSVRPADTEEVRRIFDFGVERIGIGFDVASPRLFPVYRMGDYDHLLELILETASRYPGRVTTHLIVGLGESDEEILRLVSIFSRASVTVALFAFTPVKGTKLENLPAPSLERYRRIQLVSYAIERGLLSLEDLEFDDRGQLKNIPEIAHEGKAFITRGCPGCTRPYYNERPRHEPYNIFFGGRGDCHEPFYLQGRRSSP